MRILVTASRDWDDEQVINDAIENATRGISWHKVTIVVGDCPTGGDRITAAWAAEREVDLEIHAARWDLYGRAAGPIRNNEMVDSGVDICLAFIKSNSRGATQCAAYAEATDIPVRRYVA